MDLPEDFHERYAAAQRKLDEATAAFQTLQAILDEAIAAEESPEHRRRGFLLIEGEGLGVLAGVLALIRRHPRVTAAAAVSTAAAAGVAASVLALAPPPSTPQGGTVPGPVVTSVVLTAWTTAVAPLPPSLSPSATAAPAGPSAAVSAVPGPVSTGTAPMTATVPVSPSPNPSRPTGAPSTAPTSPSPSMLPTAPTATATATPGSTCLVEVDVPSLLGLCLL